MTFKTTFHFADGRSLQVGFTTPQTTYTSREGDSLHTTSTARLPSGLSRRDKGAILRTIAEEWSTHCQHSYDCCGHWYRDCSAHIAGRRLTLHTHHYRNI